MVIGFVIFIVIVLLISVVMQTSQNKNGGEGMVLKLIYTFLIGIFLAVFVGVGIAAFYPGPKYPEQPVFLKYCPQEKMGNNEQSEQLQSQMEEFDRQEKNYMIQSRTYNRNVSTIALVASIIVVIASLTLFKKIFLIADGLLLGGVLSLLYSVIRGFETDDNMFRFVVVSIGLVISLFLGYVKFVPRTKK